MADTSSRGKEIGGLFAAGRRDTWRNLLLLVILYGLVAILFRPVSLLGHVSSGDDTAYISHAFTIALDFDLDYVNEPISSNEGLWTPSKKAPAHPVGPGLMASPVVAAFSLLDRIADHPIIADHKNYQESWSFFGFFVAAALWFLLGLWLYFDSIDSIGVRFSRWTILLFAASSGVAYYVLIRPAMGHAFEFASTAMVLWGSVTMVAGSARGRSLPGVVLVIGVLLTLLVRPSDLNILLLPPAVWGLLKLCGYMSWSRASLRSDALVLGLSAMAAALAFGAISQALYSTPLPGVSATYGPLAGEFHIPDGIVGKILALLQALPNMVPLLFGSDLGLVFAAPILPAGGLAILILLFRHGAKMPVLGGITLALVLLYFALPIAIAVIWRTVGDAVGVRYLFSLLPLSILGAVLLFDKERGRMARFARLVLIALSFWALIGQAFIDTGPGLLSKPGWNSMGRYTRFAMAGYQTALAQAVVTPQAWFNMAARRLPGFIALKLSTPTNNLEKSLPATAATSVRRVQLLPASYFSAIILFWILYPLCLALLCGRVLARWPRSAPPGSSKTWRPN